ncbi:Cyclic nucleotide-binding domain-containing protein [Stackebrandtia soli]
MTGPPEPGTQNDENPQLALGTAAARNLATTTKSVPQMQAISSRWLLRKLPWVQVSGGTYRVNRRLSYLVGDGLVTFTNVGSDIDVVPAELRELALLRDVEDPETLGAIAERFTQHEFEPDQVIVESGSRCDNVYLIARGKVSKLAEGAYGGTVQTGVLADGEFFGESALIDPDGTWEFTAKAMTSVTVLELPRRAFEELVDRSDALSAAVENAKDRIRQPQNRKGEAEIAISSGHVGEPVLPGTYVDYDTAPREYELSVAQTVLRVHSRVADLFNDPMNQLEQQLRLTVEALRERQENQLVNNREFGLLHNADLKQRINTRTGPPTPDDFDELLSMRRRTKFFLAHPKAIAAFSRECTARGIYPTPVEVDGSHVPAWRGVPIYPCGKLPISDRNTTSILAMRTGEEDQGVIGLHQTGIPDEYQPSLNVRFMGVSEQAIMSYLVSVYFSAAVLVPDALGVLDAVELSN